MFVVFDFVVMFYLIYFGSDFLEGMFQLCSLRYKFYMSDFFFSNKYFWWGDWEGQFDCVRLCSCFVYGEV